MTGRVRVDVKRETGAGWILGLVAVAVAARLAAALALGASFLFADETIYVDAARRLLAGDGFAPSYSNVPAYPVLLAFLAAPWPMNLAALRCAQAVVAGAGPALLIALGVRTLGPGPALIAALLYALDPLLVVASGLLYPETLAAMLLLPTLLAAWVASRQDRLAASAATGVLLAIVVLLRPVALVLLPVLAPWIGATAAVSSARARSAARARRALHALVVGGICILALAPWGLRNYRLHGHLVPVGTAGLRGAPVSSGEITEHGLAASILRKTWREPLDIAERVIREFGHFWELYPTRLETDNPARLEAMHQQDPRLPVESRFPRGLRDWVSALSFGGELMLAAVGLAAAWRRRRAETVLLLGVTLTYTLGYALFIAKLRYRIPLLPCVLLFAGAGAIALQGTVATALHTLAARWRRRASVGMRTAVSQMPASVPRASDFRRAIENSLWFGASEAGGRLLSLLAILYLTRTLTLTGMGIVEFGLAIFTLTHVVSTGGVGILATRRAARSPYGLGRLAGTVRLVAWCHFLAILTVLAVGAWLLPRAPEMKQGMLLFGLAAGVVPLGPRFALLARERARAVAIATVAGQATFLGLCLLAVRTPANVLRVPLVLLAGMAVQSGVQLAGFVVAYGRVRLRLRAATLVSWLRATLPLGPGVMARNLMVGIDLLLLGVLVAPAEVARYGIALKIPLFLMTLAYLAQSAMFPTVVRALGAGERSRIVAIYTDTLRVAFGIALPGVVCLAAVAEPLMVLLFTDKFRASASLFGVLLWRFPLAAVSGLFRTLVWIERPAADARFAIQSLAVSILAILVLVTSLGTFGAAVGMLLGDATLLALYLRGARAHLEGVGLGDARTVARLALAGALAAAFAWRVRGAAPPVAIAGALVTWGAASLVANLPYARRLWHELQPAR